MVGGMSRPIELEVPDTNCHVMARGNERRVIFSGVL